MQVTHLQVCHVCEKGFKKNGGMQNNTVKVPIPQKLSLFCVSIYAVKAEKEKKKNACEGINQKEEKKAGGRGGLLQVRATACNKDYGGRMNYKAPRLQHRGA